MLKRGWMLLLLFAPVGLLAFSFAGCGRNSGSSVPATSGKSDTPETASSLPPIRPLLEGWEQPAVALVLSGEQHGYLEPCGCSETQSGGIARRADLFRQMHERGWETVALDLGGTLKRSNRRQSQIKFETILSALKDMGYAALAMGPEELRLGPEVLLSQHLPDPDRPHADATFLGANVVLFGSPDLGTPLPLEVVTVGGVRIGTTAILGNGLRGNVLPEGSTSAIEITDAEEALAAAVEKLEAEQPDLLVLLSHADRDESRELARKFPQFDIVLSRGREEPEFEAEMVGDTMLLSVGHKGKYVGVVGFYPEASTGRLRYELVDLDNRRFQGSDAMHEHMRAYQERLREEQVATSQEIEVRHPRAGQFVGAAKCGECHTRAFAKWEKSKHAHAYQSLSRGREGQEANWISRVHDPECLACHVTGWNPQEVLRYDSGFLSVEATPHLKGQQCENCHGPGSEHVALEEQWKQALGSVPRDELVKGRQAMHLTMEAAQKRVCHSCHDLDNSPGFQFDKYWKEIAHPWKD